MTEISEERLAWLRRCYENWTTSPIQSDAWKYRGDFEGFCRWFLREPKQ